MSSLSLDPTPKNLQEVMQQYFPIIPTNKRGANRFVFLFGRVPTSPYQSPITPTSPMPILDPKTDRLSTSLKRSKPSSEITDSVPTIE
jgi:hypothetical protein